MPQPHLGGAFFRLPHSIIRTMIRLLVGLGNPGPEYEDTRHNAGFWFVDAVARELKANLSPERSYYGLAARVNRPDGPIWLLEPPMMRTPYKLFGSAAVPAALVPM